MSISSLWAQSGRIIGELRLNNGDVPSHPILVELRLNGSAQNSAYTDSHGGFGFFNLDPSPYHVVVNDSAFQPVDEPASQVALEGGLNIVHISLSPRNDAKQAMASGGVAGSNPYLVDLADYYHRFPKSAVKEFDRGVQADREKKRDDAIQHYQKALKIAPAFYIAHNNLGADYLSKSDFSGARNEFLQASQLNQSDGGPYFNLSNVCMLTGDLVEAQLYLERGMQRQPDSAFGQFLQGTLNIRLGRLSQAESALRRSIQLDSKIAQARLQLVNLLLQQGRKEETVAQLQDFVAAFPQSPFSGKAKDLLKRLEGPAPDLHPVSD